MGESGSGKSTLALALLRSLPENGYVRSGNVIIDNQDILNIKEKTFDENFRWKIISMIFQGSMNSLDPVFSIEKQMKEILKVHKIRDGGEKYNSIIRKAITEVGLDPEAVTKRYPHELSGGMKQRIVIANSLLLEPSILIADEPSTALDVITQSQIITLLKNMKNTKKMKIVLITHDLSLIPNVVDKVIIMYAGQAVEISDIKTIFSKPLHPYTQALIKSIPNIKSTKKTIQFIKGESPNLLNIVQGCRFKSRCPQALDICENNPPDINIEGNQVKCWLYDNENKIDKVIYNK
ncbi:MAG: ABC transporter ATP-binding protein [Thermoproteota archaeon]|nr:ABC transporter ATP-binding protein [Thermoproteota archaeon]